MDLKLYQMLQETFQAELHEVHQSLIDDLLALEKIKSKDALEDILKQLFRYSHNIKGAAASASVKSVAVMAHRLEDLFTEWRNTHHFPDKKQISSCLSVVDNLLLALNMEYAGKSVDVDLYLAPLIGGKSILKKMDKVADGEYIKLPLARIEHVSAKANEFIIYQLKLANWFKEIEHLLKEHGPINDEQVELSSIIKKLAMISNDHGSFLGEFARAVQGLQDELKAMRMLPVSTLLTPLVRTVRDLASTLAKSVDLQVEGGEIELDKTILDAIKDPLQHLIRNAIDHGVESDLKRKKLGKPIPAELSIRMSQRSGKIELMVSDDGQGIDREKIKKQVVSKGFYKKDEVDQWDDRQLLDCIFISGFSMQNKITEISGRGVGLDVVKTNIEKIKGTIHVETKQGHGSSFILSLPLTLATTRGVFFKLAEHIFMLPTLALTALYAINASDLTLVDNQYVFIVENKPVSVKMMHGILKTESASPAINCTYYGLFVEHLAQRCVFLVDAIMDEHDCVIKPLPHPYTQLEQYIGVTLTGDRELVLVLDPHKLMNLSQLDDHACFNQPADSTRAAVKVIKKRVLIVDDSLTARALCTNALEAVGYEAINAINGKRAWELIQKDAFDCVITDILMPELDGFTLTQRIKQHEKYKHIPVIIVSLLDSTEDKQRGLEAGANAFIVKSEFDTHALIDIMASLV